MNESSLRIAVGRTAVSGLLARPDAPRALYVFGHGAGAGMRHPFMSAAAGALATRGIATLRYTFPYMEAGSKRIDPQPLLLEAVRAALAAGREAAAGAPLLAGGKSMGGRMTSLALAEESVADVRGLAFFGFPLHPTGRPGTARADHLERVHAPLLFLQGTRDTLADLTLLGPVVARLGERATLHVVEGADHSFHVLKRTGRTDAVVLDELADTFAAWAERVLAARAPEGAR